MTNEEIKKMAEDNQHISSDEIRQDIKDTEVEIEQMVIEADHLASTPIGMKDARINHMRADARQSGIKEREKFIEKLRAILCYRGEHHFVPCDEWEATCLYCGKFEEK